MCRLSAITSSDYFSPMENIHSLETMKEGHDGSGLGLMLKDMAGPFADYEQYPTMSAICSNRGLGMLEEYMKTQGFTEKFSWEPPIKNVAGVERRASSPLGRDLVRRESRQGDAQRVVCCALLEGAR